MRRTGLSILALVICLVVGTPAFAVIGTLDVVPAATLLLPYFQVDLNDPNGVTTLLSINNASATAVLAHVTVWSDLSVPTLAFDVYLTGYDVQTINLRDIFVNGRAPRTASDGQDPTDTISPQGPISQDINFASCNGQLPLPPLAPVQLAHIRAAHTGQGSPLFGGLCSGVDHGDSIARGYITVDTVNACSISVPSSPGYDAFLTFQNVLWGDYFYVDSANNFAQGENLVHLEASNALGPANYTFYRRYFAAGQDRREGLASTWAARYLNGGAFNGGTNLVVWRDAKRTINPFSCALVAPAPFPLSHNQIVAFDEQENPDVPEPPAFFPPVPNDPISIPWEANSVQVGGPDLPVAFDFGWLYLNLNTTVPGSQVPFEPLAQSYVAVIHSAAGRFSVGYSALQLGNVTDPAAATDLFLPVP